MGTQIAPFDLSELEAELDHVLDCTRALRKRLQQANLTGKAVVKGEDTHYGLVLPSWPTEGLGEAQCGKK